MLLWGPETSARRKRLPCMACILALKKILGVGRPQIILRHFHQGFAGRRLEIP
jgi:hypothetical protein